MADGVDGKKLLLKIGEKVAEKRNGDLFLSVRQRVNAYRLYRAFHGMKGFGNADEDEYLDGAYRFLNSSVEPGFIVECAKMEKVEPLRYVSMLV